MSTRTTVGIVGAGPAGLVLGSALLRAGIDCVVLEQRSREYVEKRTRAGLIEHRTVETLRALGLADRLLAEGARHTSCQFCFAGQRFSVDYGALTGGAAHVVYPQQFLVRDLISSFLALGGDLRFDTPVTGLREGHNLVLGNGTQLNCAFVAGADGYHGPIRATLPAGAVREYHRQYPYRWITILAAAPPSTTETTYAAHQDGFAGHMLRTAQVSRFYLQCAPTDTSDDWPEERIWKELHRRLTLDEGSVLTEGPVIDKGLLDMHTFVCEPMRIGDIFLLGDAAHVITPAGGKGMNLAIGDAAALAEAIAAHLHHGDSRRLEGFSPTRLARIWQAQQFSDWLLRLINTSPVGDDPEFDYRLRTARLAELCTRSDVAGWFAENYVGPMGVTR
jgi:p-hydroxybenzoate 3-monooxygenase